MQENNLMKMSEPGRETLGASKSDVKSIVKKRKH